MNEDVKTLYDVTPYEQLSDAELGPLTPDASPREVNERYGQVSRRRGVSLELQAAWQELRQPEERAVWDVFCAPLAGGEDALKALLQAPPSFNPVPPTWQPAEVLAALVDPTLGPELPLPEVIGGNDLLLTLSERYLPIDAPLPTVALDR